MPISASTELTEFFVYFVCQKNYRNAFGAPSASACPSPYPPLLKGRKYKTGDQTKMSS